MTTRPQSARLEHRHNKRGSLATGVAAGTWLICGVALYVVTRSPWTLTMIGVGVVVAAVFFGLLPRLRTTKKQLRHVERLRDEQHRAAAAQRAALRHLSQPPRASLPSS